jgi:aldehyde dehydrogenase (NAD+)
MDNGKPFRETKTSDIPLLVRHFYYHAGWAQLMEEELPNYKPVGVVGAIVPWNFPLMLMAWKVAPALAMGNTVVLKPASYTRLTALLFAEICAEAGLPPGVFNVVTGSGRMGSVLADHVNIDKVAFTGSTPIGQLLRRRTAGSGKKISLELGGKSPVIIYNTADLDSAVEGIVDAIFFNQGQVCCGGSRAIVQEDVFPIVLQKLKRRLESWRVGHSLEKDIDSGAVVDESQYNTIKKFCDQAEAEGCDVYYAPQGTPEGGWYWPPTVISNIQQTAEAVREEIFGPVVTVQKFRTMAEAVALANNSKFGLGGSVWTENVSLALETATLIKSGAIWVNAHNVFDAAAGFGGYKESGFGRDGGREGLFEYIKPKWEARVRPSIEFPTEKAVWEAATPNALPALAGVSAKAHQGALKTFTVDRTAKLYVGGKQKRPDGEHCRTIVNANGQLVGQVPDGSRKDIRDAVEAAQAAAAGWGKRSGHNRAQILFYIAENLLARGEEFTKRLQEQTLRSEADCAREVQLCVERLFYYAAYCDKYGGEVKETGIYGLTCSLREPVGVIGVLCPDESPLLGLISLVAPAIARGNAVVCVPSQSAPFSALDLYQVLDTSDLPGGVLNIVSGHKDTLAKTLVEHYDVQAVWYHGSETGSAAVEFAAADSMKRTWVNYGQAWNWEDKTTQGEEFLRRSVEVKNVWVMMGDGQA